MSQIKTAAPGGGRKMFLTSPFIDQAISLKTPVQSILSVIGILRHPTTWAVRPGFAAATSAQIRVPTRFPE